MLDFLKPKPKQFEHTPNNADSVQDWLPFKDVFNRVIIRRDKYVVSSLQVAPYNLSLKSDREKRRVIKAKQEAINGIKDDFQFFCYGRPVDLDSYIHSLEEKLNESKDAKRRKLLKEYIKYVAGIAAGGEALEQKSFIILPQPPSKNSREELLKRSYELAGNLQGVGLGVEVCEDKEIIDLLFTFFHPSQSAFERAPEYSGPPVITMVDWGNNNEEL